MWLLSLVTVLSFLVQETMVARPPVELQVRVNTGGSVVGCVSNWKLIPPEIVTTPVRVKQDYSARQVRHGIIMVTVKQALLHCHGNCKWSIQPTYELLQVSHLQSAWYQPHHIALLTICHTMLVTDEISPWTKPGPHQASKAGREHVSKTPLALSTPDRPFRIGNSTVCVWQLFHIFIFIFFCWLDELLVSAVTIDSINTEEWSSEWVED